MFIYIFYDVFELGKSEGTCPSGDNETAKSLPMGRYPGCVFPNMDLKLYQEKISVNDSKKSIIDMPKWNKFLIYSEVVVLIVNSSH